jgi:hypothetical protein
MFFFKEFESVNHLFFDCIVPKSIWLLVESSFKHRIDKFVDVAGRWLSNNRFLQFNFISSDILWGI